MEWSYLIFFCFGFTEIENLNLLALLTDDSRLEASSLAIIAAIEKSVADPAAILLFVVVVVGFAAAATGALSADITPAAGLHR